MTDLANETQTDRIVRLALAAGRYHTERDEARARVAELERVCEAAGIETGRVDEAEAP